VGPALNLRLSETGKRRLKELRTVVFDVASIGKGLNQALRKRTFRIGLWIFP
jgi:hypothetical protein